MKIVLVSRDQTLAKPCREILAELLGTDGDLLVKPVAEGLPPHDLCIWDFVAGESEDLTALSSSTLQRCLFLSSKKDLSTLQERAGTSDLHVLLKPITPATLGVVLG